MTELPTVLAAVDASNVATPVLRLARLVASTEVGGRLHVVHCVPPAPPAWEGLLWPFASMGDDRPAILAEVAGIALRTLRAQLRDAGIEGASEAGRIVFGPPADALLEVASELGPQTIVVGRWGEGGPVAGLLGSVATRLLHRSPRSVLIADPSADSPSLQRIGVALTEGDAARPALEAALRLADRVGGRVSPIVAMDSTGKNPRNEARAFLTRLIEGQPLPFSIGGRLGELLEKPVLLDGAPDDALIAASSDFELLVLGRANRDGVRLGRIAEQVARKAQSSVLLVPSVLPPA
jgi:nucleotide-binding universal stress UspA family protein